MSLVNFTDPSLEQLRGILGSYGNEQVGRLVKSTPTYVESRWFKVTKEVTVTEGEDETTEYKASEVLVDGTIVANGVWFDSDATNSNDPEDPIYFDNLKINSELFTGAVEVGKAYQVEFIAPKTYEEKTQYYIVPKGGGSSDFYFQIVSKDESFLPTNSYYAKYNCYLYNNLDFNFQDRSGLEDVYLPRYFEKFGVLPIGYKHGYVSKDSFTDNYIFKELDVLGNATIISGQGTSYDADIKVGNYTIPSVNVRARNVGFGDLLPTQSFQCKFGVEVDDSNDGQWYINPATFGTSDSGLL